MAKKKTKKKVAKKQVTGKMSRQQVMRGKQTGVWPKAGARTHEPKEKEALDPSTITLEQFREASREWLRADENVKLYTKRRDAQTPVVRGYVDLHAQATDKASRAFIDNAVKWMLVPQRMKTDDVAGVAALQAAISKAKGDKKRVLESCLKPTIDKKAWDSAKKLGFVDDVVCEAYEKGQVWSMRWDHTDQVSCPECRAVATRNAKFCGQCGADLTEAPEYLK